MALDAIVPESLPWKHTDEGPDDSVSHTKTALVGTTVSMPVRLPARIRSGAELKKL